MSEFLIELRRAGLNIALYSLFCLLFGVTEVTAGSVLAGLFVCAVAALGLRYV